MISKTREAVEAVYESAKDGILTIRESAFEKVLEALEEPIRNCDVGTPAEQKARYESFCKECQKITRDLPCDFDTECIFKWEQMSYKEVSK